MEEEKNEAVTFDKIKTLSFEILDVDRVERFLDNVPELSLAGLRPDCAETVTPACAGRADRPPHLTESWFC